MNECGYKVKGSFYSPVKGEDVFFVDTKGSSSVSSVAIVIDGATGMKKRVSSSGEEVTLANIVSGKQTPARVWSDLLRIEMSKSAKNPNKSLIDVIQGATKWATEQFPSVAGEAFPAKLDALQVPSAAVLVTRVRDGLFEVCSNGDCGMVIRYQDGRVETYTGNKVLDDMRTERDAQIVRENPDFNQKSKEEQGKIRYQYMQATKEAWGEKYFTPYLGGADKMEGFKNVTDVQTDEHKTLTTYAGGMMWTLTARAKDIHSIALFSDGIDPAFMDNEIAKEIMFATDTKTAIKTLAILSRLGALMQTNQHAVAVQSVNKGASEVKKKPVFDDRAAWLLHFNQRQK